MPFARWLAFNTVAAVKSETFLPDVSIRASNTIAIEMNRLEKTVMDAVSLLGVAQVRRRASDLTVMPLAEGMRMHVQPISHDDYLLSIGGWSDYFADVSSVSRLMTLALCGRLRLIESFYGGEIWRHELEVLTSDGRWVSLADMSYVRWSLTRKELSQRVCKYPDATETSQLLRYPRKAG